MEGALLSGSLKLITHAAADAPSTKTVPATATPAGSHQEHVGKQLQEAEEVKMPSDIMSASGVNKNPTTATDEEATDIITFRTGPAQKNPSVILLDEHERQVGCGVEFIYSNYGDYL